MKPEIVRETERAWREQPEKAKGFPVVKARSEGSRALLEAGPFTWQADLPPPLGGSNAAPSPTAMMLGALAGCAVVFIRDTLAPQLGVAVDEVEATARCESDARGLLGMAGAAPDLKDIRLEIKIRSAEPEERVRRVYEAWLQRCPIYLALSKPMPIETALAVEPG